MINVSRQCSRSLYLLRSSNEFFSCHSSTAPRCRGSTARPTTGALKRHNAKAVVFCRGSSQLVGLEIFMFFVEAMIRFYKNHYHAYGSLPGPTGPTTNVFPSVPKSCFVYFTTHVPPPRSSSSSSPPALPPPPPLSRHCPSHRLYDAPCFTVCSCQLATAGSAPLRSLPLSSAPPTSTFGDDFCWLVIALAADCEA